LATITFGGGGATYVFCWLQAQSTAVPKSKLRRVRRRLRNRAQMRALRLANEAQLGAVEVEPAARAPIAARCDLTKIFLLSRTGQRPINPAGEVSPMPLKRVSGP
jgi:hypothetical protein